MELLYKETLRSLFTNAKLNVQLVQPIMQLLKEEFALHVLLDGLWIMNFVIRLLLLAQMEFLMWLKAVKITT